MQIQNLFLISVLFLASTTTYADDASEIKNDIFKCRAHHNSKIVPGNTDIAVADKYCVTVMDPVTYCAEQKLINKMSSGSLSNDEIAKIRSEFKAVCRQNETANVSTALTPAQPAPATEAAQAAQAAQLAQATQAQQAQAAQLSQQQQAVAAQAAAAQAQAAAQQNAAANSPSSQQNTQQTAMLMSALGPAASMAQRLFSSSSNTSRANPSRTATSATAAGPAPAAAPAAGGPSMSVPPNPPPTPGTAATPEQNLQSSQEQIAALAPAVTEQAPELGSWVDRIRNFVTGGSGQQATPSEITKSSEVTSRALTSRFDPTAETAVSALSAPGAGAPFALTAAAIKKLQAEIKVYAKEAKVSCAKVAETTEFLCVEGTSPGAVAVKGLMHASGPVLGVIQSMQKACSMTSNITALASAGMTAARAVCVASKVTCDLTCGRAASAINAANLNLTKDIQTAANADLQSAANYCGTIAANLYPACAADIRAKTEAVKQFVTTASTAIKNETLPATFGTSPSLVAKCEHKIIDIAGMAMNIGNLIMAKNSADKCDKKLSVSGAAGGVVSSGAVSTESFCQTAANASTQLCKCKANNSAEGCPGEQEAALKGLDIKTGKAVSGFASSSGGGELGDTKSGLDSISQSASADASSGKLSLSDVGSVVAPVASGGGSNFNGSGGGGKASGAGDTSAKPEQAANKMSFGSFSAPGGGFMGGGKVNSANGNASAKSDAIQRKIASDKLAAEITSSSGKSNWEKVRQVYLIKENTLLSGQ